MQSTRLDDENHLDGRCILDRPVHDPGALVVGGGARRGPGEPLAEQHGFEALLHVAHDGPRAIAAVLEHRLGLQFGHRHPLGGGERVCRRQCDERRVVEQPDDRRAGRHVDAAHHRDVDNAVERLRGVRVAVEPARVHADIGMELRERVDDLADRDAGLEADGQEQLIAGRRLSPAPRGAGEPEQGRRLINEHPPRIRQPHVLGVTLEQPHAEVVLECLDRPAQRGLGDEQLARRAGEAQVPGDRHEVAKLAQVQVCARVRGGAGRIGTGIRFPVPRSHCCGKLLLPGTAAKPVSSVRAGSHLRLKRQTSGAGAPPMAGRNSGREARAGALHALARRGSRSPARGRGRRRSARSAP